MHKRDKQMKSKKPFPSHQKKLRVLIGTLEVGGAEIHLSHVLPALASQGWSIQLVVLSDKVFLKSRFLHETIKLVTVPSFSSRFKFIRRAVKLGRMCCILAKVYKDDPHTLTHFFLPSSYVLGRLVSFFTSATGPWVMSRRSLRVYQKRIWGFSLLERFLHQRCGAILVNSDRIRQELISHENVRDEKIHLIYNGLPQSVSHPSSSQINELRISSGSTVIVHVANFIPYKGHLDLLQALGSMNASADRKWVVVFIGKGEPYKKYLQEEARKLKIEKNLRWISSCSDSSPYLSMAHIGVLPSHEEGFSNALLEKMSAGLPVIATDVGGNGEAVIHNETGLLVPPHDPRALTEALEKLMQDKALRLSMGKKGKKRFLDYFGLDRCVREYDSFYNELLRESKKPRDIP